MIVLAGTQQGEIVPTIVYLYAVAEERSLKRKTRPMETRVAFQVVASHSYNRFSRSLDLLREAPTVCLVTMVYIRSDMKALEREKRHEVAKKPRTLMDTGSRNNTQELIGHP